MSVISILLTAKRQLTMAVVAVVVNSHSSERLTDLT